MAEPTRVEIAQPKPFGLVIDIQGNFHRGLMIGCLIGFFLGILVVSSAALVISSVR